MSKIHVYIESHASCSVVDLPALIRENLADYLTIDLNGEEAWQRPAVFLDSYLRELTRPINSPWEPKVIEPGFADELEVDFSWRESDWLELLAVCPEADPTYNPEDVNDLRRPHPWDVPLPLEFTA